MKKQNLKSLVLNKKVISKLKVSEIVAGGQTTSASTPAYILSFCDDLPTVNDSCFSWCDNRCNDV